MELHFQGTTYTLDQDYTTHDVIRTIHDLLGKAYYFSHLIIDGEEIKEELEEVLEARNGRIDTLEVVAVTARQFVNELLLSTEEYLLRALPSIHRVVDRFHSVPKPEDYANLNELFAGIQWLNSMIVAIDESAVRPADWDDVQITFTQITQVISEFEPALTGNDALLLADLLSYEIIPVFEKLAAQVSAVIDAEGERHDVH